MESRAMKTGIGIVVPRDPLTTLRDEHARVMKALVMAVRAARCWHDVKEAADAMIDLTVCQFNPLLREAEFHMRETNGPLTGAVPAQHEHQ